MNGWASWLYLLAAAYFLISASWFYFIQKRYAQMALA
jgi:hypothetical protein